MGSTPTHGTNRVLEIKLPNSAVKYILYQRTGYHLNEPFFSLLTYFGALSFSHLYKLSVELKSIFYSSQVKSAFVKDMNGEISLIKKYLPKTIDSILDIGCGVAGIDVMISNYYKNKINVYLLDKTLVDKKVFYKFEKRASFYNSLDLARKILEINGVASASIHTQEATANNKIKFKTNFDLIISLISWGFHYPVEIYLNEAYAKLKKGGVLIIDIRKDTGGVELVKKKFGNLDVIKEFSKFVRIRSVKKF